MRPTPAKPFGLHLRVPFLVLMLCGCCAARADALDDRFALTIGTFFLTTSTTVRADGSVGAGAPIEVGTPIDLEHELGVGNKTSIRIDGYWRFLERHKIRIMYFDENRSASRTIDQDIIFRGQTYPINTNIDSRFDTVVAELAYDYAFLRGEHYELAGTFGIHDLSFKLKLTATGQSVSGEQSGSANVNGPLPVFGLHYVWQFAPQWSLDAMFQFFTLKFEQYDGNLQDWNATVFYMPWKNFGFGAGWNTFRTNLTIDNASYDGSLKWHYSGARIFFRASY
jgi:hypothetical protein